MSWLFPTSEELCRRAEEEYLKEFGTSTDAVPIETVPVPIGNDMVLNTACVGKPVSGEPVPLVMLHGFGAGLAVYAKVMGRLFEHAHSNAPTEGSSSSSLLRLSKEQHLLYAIDWLGMGRSSRPTFAPNSLQEAEDFFVEGLEAWRNSVGIERFHCCAHSLGAYLSAVYALRYPERVASLVLVSPVGLPHIPPEVQARRENAPWIYKLVFSLWDKSVTPQGLMRWAGPFGPKLMASYTHRRFPNLSETEERLLTSYLYHINVAPQSGEHAMNTILKAGGWARDPLEPRLKAGLAASIPVTFLYGDHDWMDYRHAERVIAVLNAQHPGHGVVIRIPGAGHQVFLDAPDAFVDAVVCSVGWTVGRGLQGNV